MTSSLQAVKNLVFIGKLLYKTSTLHQSLSDTSTSSSSIKEHCELLDSSRCGGGSELDWLISEMGWLARQEAGHHPKETIKRTCVFQWTAAVAIIVMGEQGLDEWMSKMLPPLYKELSGDETAIKTAGKRQLHETVLVTKQH